MHRKIPKFVTAGHRRRGERKAGKAGSEAAEALREAQEFVRDEPSHPKWKHPSY